MRMQKMLKYLFRSKKQRRMGVEPTRDRAERPPSRFEDGETHRGPYTSTRYSGIDLTDCQATRLKWVAQLERPGIYPAADSYPFDDDGQ